MKVVLALAFFLTAVSAQYGHPYGLHHAATGYAPAAYAEEPHYKPSPYNFGYDIDDGYGNTHHQTEEGDKYGNKRGSYGYTDAYGVYRKVEYVADENGFRATVKTNEPGTKSEDPASVKLISNASPVLVKAPAYHAPASYAPAPVYAPAYAPAYKAAPVGYGFKAASAYHAPPSYAHAPPAYAHAPAPYRPAYRAHAPY